MRIAEKKVFVSGIKDWEWGERALFSIIISLVGLVDFYIYSVGSQF